jgi:hypothetical protein
MYALCGPETYGPFVCDLLLHTYVCGLCTHVRLDICITGYIFVGHGHVLLDIYICWIYVLLDRCTTVYMLLLLPEASTKKMLYGL